MDFKNKNDLDGQTEGAKPASGIMGLQISLKKEARKAKEKVNLCSQFLSEKPGQVFSTRRH